MYDFFCRYTIILNYLFIFIVLMTIIKYINFEFWVYYFGSPNIKIRHWPDLQWQATSYAMVHHRICNDKPPAMQWCTIESATTSHHETPNCNGASLQLAWEQSEPLLLKHRMCEGAIIAQIESRTKSQMGPLQPKHNGELRAKWSHYIPNRMENQ